MIPPDPVDYLAYLLSHKDTVIAPWIAGCAIDIYCAGIYTSALFRYYTRPNPHVAPDTRNTRWLVALVAVLSAYKTVTACYILFLLGVALNGDQIKLSIASLTNKVLLFCPLTTQFVDLAVQCYYVILLYQIFRIDGGQKFHPALPWIIFVSVAILTVVALVTGSLAVSEMITLRFLHAPEYLATQLACGFVCDLIISVGTIYTLLKSNFYSAKDRSTFVRIARLIALSASAPALCALLNVSIVATNVTYNRWHVFFDFALSKAFAISFMWTVEVRRDIRQQESRKGRQSGGGVNGGGDSPECPTSMSPQYHHGHGGPGAISSSPNQDFFNDSRFAQTVHVSRLPPRENSVVVVEMSGIGEKKKEAGGGSSSNEGGYGDGDGDADSKTSPTSPVPIARDREWEKDANSYIPHVFATAAAHLQGGASTKTKTKTNKATNTTTNNSSPPSSAGGVRKLERPILPPSQLRRSHSLRRSYDPAQPMYEYPQMQTQTQTQTTASLSMRSTTSVSTRDVDSVTASGNRPTNFLDMKT